MATITVPFAGGFDFDTLAFPDMTNPSVVTTHTTTTWRVTHSLNNYDEYIGVGLTYDGGFVPSGGTITGIKSVVNGVAHVQITGLSVSGADFHTAFAGNNVTNFHNLILAGNDTINGSAGVDHLLGGDGNDVLDGKGGADTLEGGKGNDTYLIDNAGDSVVEDTNAGTDLVKTAVAITGAFADVENYTYTGTAAWTFTGNDLDNVITGSTGKDNLSGGDGNDTLNGGAADDTLSGGDGDDTLNGGAGNDAMTGGKGNDTYIFDAAGDKLAVDDEEGTSDTIQSSVLITKAWEGVENYTYTGASAWTFTASDTGDTKNILIGGSGADTLKGGIDDDTLTGNAGNDILDGGTGNDAMTGGLGNDTYFVDIDDDTVTEAANAGTDTVKTAISFNLLTNGQNVENLIALTGMGKIDLTGNALVNTLTGNEADNKLDGGVGADTMVGGDGNDYYYVDNVGDKVTELAANGTNDTIESTLTFSLAALTNVENLVLTGDALNGTGNAQKNEITGNAKDNILDGGVGDDSLLGGAGNDTYLFDSLGDGAEETASNGTDTIKTSAAITTAFDEIENYTYTGAAAWTFTGNTLNNVITGNTGKDNLSGGDGNDTLNGGAADDTLNGGDGDDTLNGGAGNDSMTGGKGNDTYIFDAVGDKLAVDDEEGTSDTIQSSVLITKAWEGVENYTYTGASAWTFTASDTGDTKNTLRGGSGIDNLKGGIDDDTLFGNAGNDILDGGTGNDAMTGGLGDDTYFVDFDDDTVTEAANAGTDTVKTAINFNLLTNGQNVENLIALAGMGNIDLTGNALVNTLTGNEGNNKLDGGVGADTMVGGAGNDYYSVDNVGDKVTELAGGGTNDTIESSLTFSLAALTNVENLVLVGDALNGTGNALKNDITGNAKDNILDGGIGDDSLLGGAGNDTYLFDSLGDGAEETAGNGTDTIKTSVAITNATDEIENYTYTGTAAWTFTGNTLNNVITGNTGKDNLSGGDGNDTLNGGAADDTLSGGDGDDILNGGTGNDTMTGGKGNDTYIFDAIGDKLAVDDEEGDNDTIQSSALITTATTGIESYTYTGASAWTFTADGGDNTLSGGSGIDTLKGAAGDDKLLGNAGNDILDGGTGNDAMTGGLGDDTYFVDSDEDSVTEAAKGGTDTIKTTVDIDLATDFAGQEIENVTTLAGGTTQEIIGNLLNNVINASASSLAMTLSGGGGNDTLTGGTGSDDLDGGTGADAMTGGAGNDYYHVDNAGDKVTELAGASAGTNDTIESTLSFSLATLANVENLVLTGDALNGTGNAQKNEITGNAKDNILDGGAGADTLEGGEGSDVYLLDNVNDDVIESVNDGTDVVKTSAAITDAFDNVEHYTYTGTTAWKFTANELNNIISSGASKDEINGGAGNDIIVAGAGDDTLIGGEGNDTLDGGAGNDTYIFNVGDGEDTLHANSYNTGDIIKLAGSNFYDLNYERDSVDLFLAQAIDGDYNFGDTGQVSLLDFFVGTGSIAVQIDTQFNEDFGANKDLATFIFQRGLTGTNNATTSEIIFGTDGNDVINGNGGFYDALYGGEGNDTINGGSGTDWIRAGEDNDILNGGAGNDFLRGEEGADTLNGGDGIDRADYKNSALGINVDLSAGKAFNDGFNSQDILTGIENVRGSSHNDTIVGDGNANFLEGRDGDDALAGGAGNDVLSGGDGADEFRFSALGEGDDVITDFDGAVDKISFADALDKGNGGILDDVAGIAATEVDGNVIVTFANGHTLTFIGAATGSIDSFDDLLADPNAQFTTFHDSNKTLTGGVGNDVLVGGAGDDTLTGNAGNDTLQGGVGNDSLNGGVGNDLYIFNIGDGEDTLAAGTYNTGDIIKLAGSDIYDLNYEWNGKDLILAQAIDDKYDFADTGKLTLANFFGGTGSITVQIDTENYNEFYGTDPNISTFTFQRGLTGTNNANSAEVIVGTDGNDVINGNGGFYDSLYGGKGNDTITGGSGLDYIRAGEGNDVLNGAAGNDTLRGEAGDDTLNGGDGIDRADYKNSAAGVIVDLSAGKALDDGFGNADILNSIENVRGSAHNDMITGDGNDNQLAGLDGDDVLIGGAGNDVLTGGTGVDEFRFSAFGEGDDVIADFNRAEDKLAFSSGLDVGNDGILNDLSGATVAVDGPNVIVTFANGHTLTLWGAAVGQGTIDSIDDLVDDPNTQFITFIDPNKTLTGGAGNDSLGGGAGHDHLFGAAGNDVLTGGLGNDYLDGGTGNDVYNFGVGDGFDVIGSGTYNTGDVIKLTGSDFYDLNYDWDGTNLFIAQAVDGDYDYAATGKVTVSNFFTGTGTITVQIDTQNYNEFYGTDANISTFTFQRGLTGTNNATSAEVIIGTDGNDVINGNGGFYDSIYGGDGNDVINGGSGSDWIRAGDGNDTLNGAGGNDNLRGDAGYDILNGGAGIDRADYNRADDGVIVDLSLGRAMYDGQGAEDTLNGIENVRGSAFNDYIGGDANANRLEGREGDDILTGGGGDDNLLGGNGADTFRFMSFGEGNDVIEDFTVGQDSLSFAASLGGDVAGAIAGVVDDGVNVVATFTNGKTLTLWNVGTNSINTANDFVNTFGITSFEALKVLGGTGNDPLNGSTEDDALIGGAGNDTLTGGKGNDYLDGGAGNDIYNFEAGDGFDGIGAGTYNTGDIIKFTGTKYYDLNFDWDDTHLYVAPAVNGDYNFDDSGSITLANFFGGTGSITVQIDTNYNDYYGTDPDLATVIFQRGLTGTNNASTSEIIIGGDGNDVINGNGGYYDGLFGNGGNDTINGGAGFDRIDGADGNDTLNGAGGNDTLMGGAGFDVINGGAGFDLADYRNVASGIMVDLSQNKAFNDGFGSQDTFTGVEGVRGSSHDDIIIGDANENWLYGLDGADILAGGGGNDVLFGGDGADTFRFNGFNEGLDWIDDFDKSTDILSFAKSLDVANDGIQNDLASATVFEDNGNVVVVFAGGGSVTLFGAATGSVDSVDDLVDDANTQITTFDKFVGGAAADTFVGTDAGDILAGAGGNDTLTGGWGNDYLDGGAGNDIYNFEVGDGFDVLGSGTYNTGDIIKLQGGSFYDLNYNWTDTDLTVAQAIDDKYDVADTGALTLANFFGGSGSVTVQIDVGEFNADFGTDANLATFIFQRGLTGTNNVNTAEVIIGTDGNDVINGNGGFYDSLYGGDGNDTINGGAGTDWIRAGDGNDILNGAGGDDHLRGEAGFDILNGGAGIDQADYRNSEGAVTVDLAIGRAENDGFGYEDTLTGIENVRGSAFNDLIVGDGNANVLRGLDGDDTLTGALGDDTLDGGLGDDTLNGGAGVDTHRFSEFGEGHDVINGFNASQDKLAFADILDVGQDGILDDLQGATTVSDDGTDVLVTFTNGGSLTFHGIGTGAINDISQLVADPNSQITTY